MVISPLISFLVKLPIFKSSDMLHVTIGFRLSQIQQSGLSQIQLSGPTLKIRITKKKTTVVYITCVLKKEYRRCYSSQAIVEIVYIYYYNPEGEATHPQPNYPVH